MFDRFIKEQVTRHPSFQPQDGIKLCFQAAYGAEHLLQDREAVFAYFIKEYTETETTGEPLFEPVSAEFSRVNLGAWKARELPEAWLFEMFFLTASQPMGDRTPYFSQLMDVIENLAGAGALSFDEDTWKTARNRYEAAGGGAVHHSDTYRNAEHPAYRIVHAKYVRLIPLLERMHAVMKQTLPPHVLAIDGRAASGKSTLAAQLAAITGGSPVQLDDFFLPPALRTPERLAEAGGNVHYERFAAEVLPHLGKPGDFAYQCFDCSCMELGEMQIVPQAEWQIVEGSYSHHPRFGSYMDIRVFCDVDPELQRERICSRNGEVMLQMFVDRWIPMEEQYFAAFDVKEKAHIVLSISEITMQK